MEICSNKKKPWFCPTHLVNSPWSWYKQNGAPSRLFFDYETPKLNSRRWWNTHSMNIVNGEAFKIGSKKGGFPPLSDSCPCSFFLFFFLRRGKAKVRLEKCAPLSELCPLLPCRPRTSSTSTYVLKNLLNDRRLCQLQFNTSLGFFPDF